MPEFEKEEFKFPHEEKDEKVVKNEEEEKFEIEVVRGMYHLLVKHRV